MFPLFFVVLFGGMTLANSSPPSKALSFAQDTFASQFVRKELNTLRLKRHGQVSLVCLEVKSHDASVDWSNEYVRMLSENQYPFLIKAESDCGKDEIDEQTFKISTVFSNCDDKSCSVRTYAKRVREWCATGWRTTRSEANVQGFKFMILDGLREELIGSLDGAIIRPQYPR